MMATSQRSSCQDHRFTASCRYESARVVLETEVTQHQGADVMSQRRERFRGTFLPFWRASDRPIAMACFRLLTFPPLPPLPLRSVPCFRLRMARSTSLLAPRLYLRPPDLLFAM